MTAARPIEEVVAELRKRADDFIKEACEYEEGFNDVDIESRANAALDIKAADLITSLSREKAELAKIAGTESRLVNEYHAANEELVEANAALQSRLDAVEEALRPFAKLVSDDGPETQGHYSAGQVAVTKDGLTMGAVITHSQLRQAALALTAVPKVGDAG